MDEGTTVCGWGGRGWGGEASGVEVLLHEGGDLLHGRLVVAGDRDLGALLAPRVMIMRLEEASTGSPPARAICTSASTSPAAAAMTAAGRACRPTAERR
ncbi:hypothetical protein BJF82_02350 [Kytococcus sp. CUA-901]|nr:hypothetical protein BJF82_02350 [Kytococcus sp. CUA-901]